MFMGYAMVRFHLVRKEDTVGFSKLAINLIMPFSILGAFFVPFSTDTLKGILIAAIAYTLISMMIIQGTSSERKSFTDGSRSEVLR